MAKHVTYHSSFVAFVRAYQAGVYVGVTWQSTPLGAAGTLHPERQVDVDHEHLDVCLGLGTGRPLAFPGQK